MPNLESTLMFRLEALDESGWGAMLDYSFVKLQGDISLLGDAELDTRIRQRVLQADAFYRQTWRGGLLDFTAGMRWWGQEIDVELDTAILPGDRRVEAEEDWIDLVLGARFQWPLSENWTGMARGDVGGFGLEADFTTQWLLGAKYSINDAFLVDVYYKAVWVDYDNGERGQPGYFAYDTITYGPAFGLIYSF